VCGGPTEKRRRASLGQQLQGREWGDTEQRRLGDQKVQYDRESWGRLRTGLRETKDRAPVKKLVKKIGGEGREPRQVRVKE